jgi:hypothetical protein
MQVDRMRNKTISTIAYDHLGKSCIRTISTRYVEVPFLLMRIRLLFVEYIEQEVYNTTVQ